MVQVGDVFWQAGPLATLYLAGILLAPSLSLDALLLTLMADGWIVRNKVIWAKNEAEDGRIRGFIVE